MIGLRGVAVALLTGSVLGGCGPKTSSTMDPMVEQGESLPRPETEESRAEQLGEAIDQFAAARKGLQGHSDEPARRQLADAFGRLSEVLALLKGPQQDGAFRQQIRIIDRGRTHLASGSETAPEPTINAAIRSAQRALADIATEKFVGDEKVTAAMDALRPRVDGLAGVRGPIHGFETARALDAAGAVVERMADVVQQQRLPGPQSSTAPAATNPQ